MTDTFKNTYWGNNGKYQNAVEQLNELVPTSGACDKPRSTNKALDKFRRASNVYYDVFNNGLCNRGREFYPIFKFRASLYGSYARWNWDGLVKRMEPVMDEIILAAAKEQGIDVDETDGSTYLDLVDA